MDRFIDGLRPSLRRTVLSKQPENWQAAVDIAQYEFQLEELDSKGRSAREDAFQGQRSGNSNGYNGNGYPANGPNHDNRGSNGPNNGSGSYQPGRGNGYNHPTGNQRIICYNCNKPGHIARNCYRNYGTNQENPIRRSNLPQRDQDYNQMPFNRVKCPLCGGVKFHAVGCPKATPVSQVNAYNPAVERNHPNENSLPLNRRNGRYQE